MTAATPLQTVPSAPPQFTECLPDSARASGAPDFRQMAEHLQGLIDQIQGQPNPAARVLLQDCLQSLLAFYGEGLSRIVNHLQSTGSDALAPLLHDPAVSGLLLIHGLHPVPVKTRLEGALDKARPYMQSHGGSIELLRLENDVATVRLHGTCKSCPSSAITLELAVRRAVEEACPDLAGFEVVQDQAEEERKETHVPGHSR